MELMCQQFANLSRHIFFRFLDCPFRNTFFVYQAVSLDIKSLAFRIVERPRFHILEIVNKPFVCIENFKFSRNVNDGVAVNTTF